MNSKNAHTLVIRQSRITTAGAGAGDVAESRITLAQKIEEYVFRIGCSNAHILGTLVQLLTVGKVRVDFREYYERLQLHAKSDVLSRAEAIPLIEGFLECCRAKAPAPESPEEESFLTQKITVQPPKPRES
jgi:hypothetical protein